MPINRFFPTQIFTDKMRGGVFLNQILREVRDLSELDSAGVAWSRENYKNGFTSYASVNELQRFSPTFKKLETWIDSRVASFARSLELELGGGNLNMTTCWANVMHANTHHSGHIHPLSVLSGTFYVSMPAGSPAIKFEDPRLGMLMHSPPKKEGSRPENRSFVEVPAGPGTLVLFESWLRHEVPLHRGRTPRVSISFNYDWT
jgi:uncharacterized protein (TIGR02466 family)